MSAAEKNRQALLALFGDDALVLKLSSTRIALALPSANTPPSAVLLATVLADVLGRLWPNIDFFGEIAEVALAVSHDAASSGGAPVDGMKVGWAPPYDMVISVGAAAPDATSPCIRVGADGWQVQFGDEATCGDSMNPVGPAFAAGLAAAQLFSVCFSAALEGSGLRPIGDWGTDVRGLFEAPGLEFRAFDIQETHVFGVGAVTHALVWLIENWPEPVSGELHLVDGDAYGEGNGQRYAFMKPGSIGTSKVEAVATRLKSMHLAAEPHSKGMNDYCEERGHDRPLLRVIAGLDSEESRRQAGLKDPERAINMWTSGSYIGAGQYVPGHGRGCLVCAYPESIEAPLDEVAKFHKQTGLLPDVVRELLDSARGLTAEEAHKVAQAKGVPAERIVGEPLRSVIPVLCATGKVPLSEAKEAVDVPFAFSSLLAGVAGFVMLLRDVQIRGETSVCWTQHVFKRPSPSMLKVEGRHARCVRCDAAELVDEPA
ncbi:hypothetical protein [Roseateles toxinivorans]|uniref:ThiF family protein n=1 Tax=Roseateles toxinivorans TaxID=270368 RepID=A0A4R6QPR4_9BURK|nr:hypothetical protein [Roseateles toxinivorans]TDP72996.1 ThiF family protein [Roseateles toxinivorans]